MSHKIGDRVRVTVEGEVTYAAGGYTNVTSGPKGSTHTHTVANRNATIEVLPPPVETFRVGDTVRAKNAPSVVFSLGHGGYFDHLNNIWQASSTPFTSKSFEKVELA